MTLVPLLVAAITIVTVHCRFLPVLLLLLLGVVF